LLATDVHISTMMANMATQSMQVMMTVMGKATDAQESVTSHDWFRAGKDIADGIEKIIDMGRGDPPAHA